MTLSQKTSRAHFCNPNYLGEVEIGELQLEAGLEQKLEVLSEK
jgi:hypothetical protein